MSGSPYTCEVIYRAGEWVVLVATVVAVVVRVWQKVRNVA
jgi:hypothetical protein